jgi:hypothetical protein
VEKTELKSDPFHFKWLFQVIATALGLDQSSNANLWRDRVAVEINTAVLVSILFNLKLMDTIFLILRLGTQTQLRTHFCVPMFNPD